MIVNVVLDIQIFSESPESYMGSTHTNRRQRYLYRGKKTRDKSERGVGRVVSCLFV